MATLTTRQKSARTDWGDVLDGLGRGEPTSVLAVTRVITGFLIRARAYDLRGSWEDLCQDVLLALVKSHSEGRLRDADAFIGYVGAITRNKMADWLTTHRRAGVPIPLADILPSATAPLRDDELLLDLQRALEELGDRERRVIEAVYIEGRSYEQSAELLGMPLGTLKRLQTAALRQLRGRMLAPARTKVRIIVDVE